MKKKIVVVVVLVIIAVGIAAAVLLLRPDPVPLPLACMVPASTTFYAEFRNPALIAEWAGVQTSGSAETSSTRRASLEGTWMHERMLQVTRSVLGNALVSPGTQAAVVVDLTKFSYLPSFALVLNVEDGQVLKKQMDDALTEMSERFLVASARSRGWDLTVVGIGEETSMYVGRRGRTVIVSNSADLYDDVVTTTASEQPSLTADKDFKHGLEQMTGVWDVLVFARPGELGERLPVDQVRVVKGSEGALPLLKRTAEVLKSAGNVAAAFRLGGEIEMEIHISGPSEGGERSAMDVPPGRSMSEALVTHDAFLVYSFRVGFPKLWDVITASGMDGGFTFFSGLKAVIPLLGPEVTVAVGDGVSVVLVQVKERSRVQQLIDEFVDTALRRSGEKISNYLLAAPCDVVSLVQEQHKGIRIRRVVLSVGEEGKRVVEEVVYAFVGDFLVLTQDVPSVHSVMDAYKNEKKAISRHLPFKRAIVGFPSTYSSRLYLDVRRAASAARERVSALIGEYGEFDGTQKSDTEEIADMLLDLLETVESYGSVSVRDGRGRLIRARLTIAR